MEARFFFIAAALLSSCSFGEASNNVPVLIWSSNSPLEEDNSLFSGLTVPFTRLRDSYLDQILQRGPQNLVLFLWDELSLDDFTVYGDAFNADGTGGVFKNIKSELESGVGSVVLESVALSTAGQGASPLVDYLTKRADGGVIHQGVTSGGWQHPQSEFTQLHDPSTTNLLVYKLPGTPKNSHEARKRSFKEGDEIVGDVMSQLSILKKPYTAILTANSPSKIVRDTAMDDLEGKGRRLLAVTQEGVTLSAGTLLNVSDCIYFYMEDASLIVNYGDDLKEHVEVNITQTLTVDTKTSSCNATSETAVLVATAKDEAQGLTNLLMKITFMRSNNSIVSDLWNISSLNLTYEYSSGEVSASGTDLPQSQDHLYAAYNQSYKCGNLTTATPQPLPDPKATSTANIRFTNFQVEPFLAGPQFSEPVDCVGLFSDGAWMSLFTALILGLIFLFGLSMLMSLEVMDKFDDPKAKTITVAAAAD